MFYEWNLKTKLIEADDGKMFAVSSFADFPKSEDIKTYSRLTSKRALFAQIFHRMFLDFPRKSGFKNQIANWGDEFPSALKNYPHFSTKLTPIKTSIESKGTGTYHDF